HERFMRPSRSPSRSSSARPLSVILLLGRITVAAAATDSSPLQWPQFRGPNSSGVAEANKPPVEFNATTNLQWKSAVPPGLSSPCVWGDRIFLTAVEEGKLATLCFERRAGKVLWRQLVSADKPR